MSIKYFGEFLIHKGVIDKKDLVDSLIKQVSSQPPISQIAFENEIFDAEELLKIFHHQQDHQSSFINSCTKLGLWSEEVESKINEVISKVRPPLGQILVNQGKIDLKSLTHMLDEFLAQVEVVQEKEVETFSEYQEGILSELEEIFDERKNKVIKVAISLIRDSSENDSVSSTKLFQDVLKIARPIDKLLKLFGVEYLGKLFSTSLDLIEQHLSSGATFDDKKELADILYQSLEEAWKMRSLLISTQSEKKYLNDPLCIERYNNILTQIESYQMSQTLKK